MKYGSDFVEKIADRLMSGDMSLRAFEKAIKVPRKTLGR